MKENLDINPLPKRIKKLTIYYNQELDGFDSRQLRVIAHSKGYSMSEWIRKLIRKDIKKD